MRPARTPSRVPPPAATAVAAAAAGGVSRRRALFTVLGVFIDRRPARDDRHYVLYYWAPFLLGAALTVGALGALVAVARRSM